MPYSGFQGSAWDVPALTLPPTLVRLLNPNIRNTYDQLQPLSGIQTTMHTQPNLNEPAHALAHRRARWSSSASGLDLGGLARRSPNRSPFPEPHPRSRRVAFPGERRPARPTSPIGAGHCQQLRATAAAGDAVPLFCTSAGIQQSRFKSCAATSTELPISRNILTLEGGSW